MVAHPRQAQDASALAKGMSNLRPMQAQPQPAYSPKEPTMSNPNFVNDLVMMAKAYEELPQVKQDLANALDQEQILLERIQDMQLRLIDTKTELDAAHAATRKAEVERDHAERMFLEADDAKLAAVRAMRSIIDEAQGLIQIIQPEPQPKPEVKVGASEEDVAPGQSATPPTESSSLETSSAGNTSTSAPTQTSPNSPTTVSDATSAVNSLTEQDQSESGEHGLATTSTPTDATSQSETATSSGAESTVPVSTEHSEASEVAPTDPTASSTAGDGPLPDTAAATTNAEPQADASTSEQPTATVSEGADWREYPF